MGLPVVLSGPSGAPPEASLGCYVSLSSVANQAQIGLRADPAACRAVTGAVLGMTPDEAAELGEEDVVDGVGELVNVVAGLAKTKLASTDADLRMGLPMFVRGHVGAGPKSATRSIRCDLGGTRCTVEIHASVPAEAA